MKQKDRPQILRDVFQASGSASKLAVLLGVTRAALCHWRRVPLRHLKRIEEITQIPRVKLRPDIYD